MNKQNKNPAEEEEKKLDKQQEMLNKTQKQKNEQQKNQNDIQQQEQEDEQENDQEEQQLNEESMEQANDPNNDNSTLLLNEIVQTEESDLKSVFVKNVEYMTTKEELSEFFKDCGNVKRVTIPSDKFSGPKGFAYIEFDDIDGVQNALAMSGSVFNQRTIQVLPKRTNIRQKGKSNIRGKRRGGHRGSMNPYQRGMYMYVVPPRRGRGGFRPYNY